LQLKIGRQIEKNGTVFYGTLIYETYNNLEPHAIGMLALQ